jgi:hypothetical protein
MPPEGAQTQSFGSFRQDRGDPAVYLTGPAFGGTVASEPRRPLSAAFQPPRPPCRQLEESNDNSHVAILLLAPVVVVARARRLKPSLARAAKPGKQQKAKRPKVVVLPWIAERDFEMTRLILNDRLFPQTHAAWLERETEHIEKIEACGDRSVKVKVDPRQFLRYCKLSNIGCNEAALTTFAIAKVSDPD